MQMCYFGSAAGKDISFAIPITFLNWYPRINSLFNKDGFIYISKILFIFCVLFNIKILQPHQEYSRMKDNFLYVFHRSKKRTTPEGEYFQCPPHISAIWPEKTVKTKQFGVKKRQEGATQSPLKASTSAPRPNELLQSRH